MTFLSENSTTLSDELLVSTVGTSQDWWRLSNNEGTSAHSHLLLSPLSNQPLDEQEIRLTDDESIATLNFQPVGKLMGDRSPAFSNSASSSIERALIVKDVSDADPITGGSLSAALVMDDAPVYPGYSLSYEPDSELESRPAVAQWQAQMQKRGWTIEVDGLYGPESERVAIAFQKEKGLTVDGIVGPQTWQVAFDESTITESKPANRPVSEPTPAAVIEPYSGRQLSYNPLAPLEFDAQTQQLQQRLQSLGWQIETDGLFGPKTERVVQQFQNQASLDSDGIVGSLTWAALFSDDAPTAPIEQNFDSVFSSGRINEAGLDLIKSFEGLRLNAYQDAVGVWTIGYGHTSSAYPGQRITTEQATALLRQDVANFEDAVTRAVRVPITENQFAALVSFTYNVGSGALNSSTLLRKLNAGDTLGAANEFLRWNRAGGRVLAGLTRRREAERLLFLS